MRNSILSFVNSFGNIYVFLILLSYITVFLYPTFGSIDKSATQYLLISFINCISLAYILTNLKLFIPYLKIIYSFLLIKNYLFFISLILISLIFSFNIIESLVVLFQYFTFFTQFFIITLLFFTFKISIRSFVFLLIFFHCFQLYYSLSTYLEIISISNYQFDFSSFLKGVGSNRNITAVIFCLHLPFILYLILTEKVLFLRFLYSVLIFVSSYLIVALSSRASYISLVLIFLLSTISIFIFFRSFKFKSRFIFFLVPIILSVLYFNLSSNNNSSTDILNRISSVSVNDQSTINRLDFYKFSINYIINNPFRPMGLGNWKILSLNNDNAIPIIGYTVPYHVHNDFLEIGNEVGLLGLLSFLLCFIGLFYICISLLKSTNSEAKTLSLPLFLALMVYFIDSNLNFPMSRPIVFTYFAFISSIIIYIKFNFHDSKK